MIELLNIDCMEYMATLPYKAFDLAIVDPPYGIGFGEFNRTNKSSNGERYKANKYKNSNWDDSIPDEDYFKELKRVTENQIIWGGNYYFNILGNCKGLICWYKHQPVSNFSDCEFAWTNFDKPAKVFDYKYFGNIEGKTSAETRIHPTQKPVALYKWLLDNYATCKTCHNEGGFYEDVVGDGSSKMYVECENCCRPERPFKILDTHLGSGSIAIACHDYGFNLVGCELDKEYYDAAVKRFNNHKAQQKLF